MGKASYMLYLYILVQYFILYYYLFTQLSAGKLMLLRIETSVYCFYIDCNKYDYFYILIFALYTVKSVSKYYTQHHSPVYTCFLDASKAFDKINHFKLFRKLLDRKTPIVIVKNLLFWYSKQTVCVKWGRCRGVPRIGRGGQKFFFSQILEFACREAIRIARGFGGMLPRENFLKRCNLVRFRVYFDQILSFF